MSRTSTIDAEGLVVNIEAREPWRAGAAMRLSFTVNNPTAESRTFCTYHTPFEGMRNDIFIVEAEGQRVDYVGMMAKRAPPGPEHFLRLEPGTSKRVEIDLAEGYRLDAGSYRIAHRGTAISGLPNSPFISVGVDAD